MKKEEFANSPSGRLVPTEKGQWAFVPNDLPPPKLDMLALSAPLAEASQLLGELNGIGRTLPDPYLLIRPLQVSEALTSSSMEGTYTTIDNLLLLEAGAPERNALAQARADTREVLNYRQALSEAIDSLSSLPLSLRTLRQAHKTLLKGVRKNRGAAEPGEFKRHQNFIGAYAIEQARFIPPPPAESLAALYALENYIQREERGAIPDLIDAALIHYQFETIHPFSDGNGRVGRMLVTLHLSMRGLLKQPLLYLSPALERMKDRYIDLMYDVSRTGNFESWIVFFLNSVSQASRSAIATADALLDLQRKYNLQASNLGRSANLLRLIDFLFIRQVVSVPMVAQHLSVQYRAAQLHVETLVKADILREVFTTSNPRFFIAHEIRNVINTATGAPA